MKRQAAAFDVAAWERDEFEIFPQGARAKSALKTPHQPPDAVLRGSWRYLFKRSKRSYPDQFWGEVVAYRLGCLLGIRVPPAFAAFDSETGISGALIEWFYDENRESFILAGDFLQKLKPDFEREKGSDHNMRGNIVLLSALARSNKGTRSSFRDDWRQWWVDTLLFDALIGNTDRHQDNWGFIFGDGSIRLSPAFDNGTSLGSERFESRVSSWSEEQVDRYIAKGTHHVRWSRDNGELTRSHFEVLQLALEKWPQTRDLARHRLNFPRRMLPESISDLTELDLPIPLSKGRFDFIVRLLTRRHELLQALV